MKIYQNYSFSLKISDKKTWIWACSLNDRRFLIISYYGQIISCCHVHYDYGALLSVLHGIALNCDGVWIWKWSISNRKYLILLFLLSVYTLHFFLESNYFFLITNTLRFIKNVTLTWPQLRDHNAFGGERCLRGLCHMKVTSSQTARDSGTSCIEGLLYSLKMWLLFCLTFNKVRIRVTSALRQGLRISCWVLESSLPFTSSVLLWLTLPHYYRRGGRFWDLSLQ